MVRETLGVDARTVVSAPPLLGCGVRVVAGGQQDVVGMFLSSGLGAEIVPRCSGWSVEVGLW